MSHERVLVTGGAGFIGSHLIDKLVDCGKEVVVLDNLRTGNKSNLKDSLSRIDFVEGDIRDRRLVNELLGGFDFVFHLAGNASVPESVSDPVYDFETNVIGTFNLLNSSKSSRLKKFVFASSAAVYGDSKLIPMKETHATNPISPYGTTKVCGELLCLSFQRHFNVPVGIARIFNVYGPRLPRYAICDFYKKLKENPETLQILGDGKQTRQLCYTTDAVDALIQIAENGIGVYNVAGIETIQIRELARIMISKISPEAKMICTGKSWPGDIKNLEADISKLKELGITPKITLKRGIELTIRWLDKNLRS